MRTRSPLPALIAVLAPLVRGDAAAPALDESSIDPLLAEAARQRVTGPFLRAATRAADLPPDLRRRMADARVQETAATLVLISRASEALDRLAAAQIDARLGVDPNIAVLARWHTDATPPRTSIAVPRSRADDAAAALAGLDVRIDPVPDEAMIGRAETFLSGRALPVLTPDAWLAALSARAADKGWPTLDYHLACALLLEQCPDRAAALALGGPAARISAAAAALVFGLPAVEEGAAADVATGARAIAQRFGVEPGPRPEPADGRPRKLILRQFQSPGDIVMLTAAVRDLHRAHAGRFLTDVRTSAPDLWLHNPHVTRIADDDGEAETIECHYPLIHRSNQEPVHFLRGFIEFLNDRLGLSIRPTAFKGDVHLSDEERQRPSAVRGLLGADVPYWIVGAGGKLDFTIKWWSRARYQEVVDALQGRVLFVQVGDPEHYHPALDGVVDLRGRTNLRELIHLVHHADGVLTPVSLLMHLAAAVEPPRGLAARACVVVAGGREPVQWEAYPGHQFLHTIGLLSCCRTGGCWRSRTVALGDGDDKDQPRARCVDVVDGLPRCMDLIESADVVRAIESSLSGGAARRMTAAQYDRARPHLSRRDEDRGRPGPRLPLHAVPPPVRRSRPDIAVTIAVLGYDDYPAEMRRCLESIERFADRARYRLFVGANGVSDATRDYLYCERHGGAIDRLFDSPINLMKSAMMRRMLAEVDTPFLWWLDEDAFLLEPGVLERRLDVARASPPDAVLWGRRWYFTQAAEWAIAPDMYRFIRDASWYRGRPLPGEPGGPASWEFINGGCWLARTDALRAIDWPDPRLVQRGDDVLLSTAILQQGWTQVDIGAMGVSAGHEPRGSAGASAAPR